MNNFPGNVSYQNLPQIKNLSTPVTIEETDLTKQNSLLQKCHRLGGFL
jgi:hypothetical protein